jgi:cytochrome c peroxidase
MANCGPSREVKELIQSAKDTFEILPDKMPGAESDTEARIVLGKKLYFEKGLSIDNTVSCNTCHNIENNGKGTDNLPTSTGVNGLKGGRNSPTVLNAGYHFVQFWDGRAKDLQEQAKGPILNPVEMAMPSEEKVIEKIKSLGDYNELFTKAFPDSANPVSYDNLAEAIAAFERTLISKSRFDKFLSGNGKALSKEEQDGLKVFLDTGCTQCHNGPLLGGNSYRKLGLVNEFKTKDKGRYDVTKNKEDMYVFKVPSLRNIALTDPYFHDGSIKNLDEAINKMGWHQLGKKLTFDEIKSMAAFLGSLSGM